MSKFESGLARSEGYSEAAITVVKAGEAYVEYSQFQDFSSSGEVISNGNSVSKITTTDLGNGIFKKVGESNDTTTYDGVTDSSSFKYEVTTKIDGQKSQILNVKIGAEAEKPGVGEGTWRKMNDGRIVQQNFIREKMNQTNGETSFERLVSNSLCIYTPVK